MLLGGRKWDRLTDFTDDDDDDFQRPNAVVVRIPWLPVVQRPAAEVC